MKTLPIDAKLSVRLLPESGFQSFRLTGSGPELARIAARFGFARLERLEAEIQVGQVAPDMWEVRARLDAGLVQSCIITGAEVPEKVDFEVNERYVHITGEDSEVFVGLDGVEPLEGDEIDLGEMVAQWLALAANDWPKAPGAPDLFHEDRIEPPHPFANLASLKSDKQ